MTNNKQLNVLAVDDDHHLIMLIEQVLNIHKISCDTAKDGKEAFEKIKKKFYPLIISDIRMPHMTGTELLKEVTNYQSSFSKKSIFILMTAYSTAEIMEEADNLGVDDFITKPFDITQFVARIQSFLPKLNNL